jgi:hypothetical protein
MNKKELALEWAKGFESTKRWLNGVKQSKTGSDLTPLEYSYRLRALCEYAHENPDELVADRREVQHDRLAV